MPTASFSLPEAALDYLSGLDGVDAVEAVVDAVELDPDLTVPLLKLLDRLAEGSLTVEGLPDALVAAGVPEKKKDETAVLYAGRVLRPVAPVLGDVDGAIRSWGGEPSVFADVEILEELKVPAPTPASEPLRVAPPAISSKLSMPPLPVRRTVSSPVATRGGDMLGAEDMAEIAGHVVKAETIQAATPVVSQEPAVAAIVAAAGLKDAESQKRLANIVSARFKDVRDAYATRAELEKPPTAGGLGLTGTALVDLMEKIESAAYDVRHETDLRAAKEKSAHMERGIARRDMGGDAREQEEQLLARRYAELTGKAPTQAVGAIGARPSLAMSARESVSRAAQNIDKAKVKQAVAASAPPTLRPAAARPRMEDVRPAQRLAGPVDELRLLTLEDFRRLSKDPKTAMAKVLDQAELLRGQGEDQWFAAVKAWRASPLNGWYIKAMQEALVRGTDVRTLLAEKRAAGETVPTDAEVAALTALNGQLRF